MAVADQHEQLVERRAPEAALECAKELRFRGHRLAHTTTIPQPATDPSFLALTQLWNGSWQASLAALDAAARLGAMSPGEAATRRSKIIAEREIVTDELREIAGGWLATGLPREGVSFALAQRQRRRQAAERPADNRPDPRPTARLQQAPAHRFTTLAVRIRRSRATRTPARIRARHRR
jgi:hypothetical protein